MDRRGRVARALANPVYFHVAYIAPYDPNWDHSEPMPEFAQQMLRFAVGTDRGVVMLPPEFLKTTILSQTLPLWLTARAAYFGTQLRGMLMSEEEDMAGANLGIIAWHILNNEALQRDFSDDRGRPLMRPSSAEGTWKEDAIIIDRAHPSRDPTWQAKGLDSKGIHGRRLDVFIGDDIVTPRNAESPAQKKRALDVFDLQVMTRLVAGAKALICGNYITPDDLPSTIAKRRRWRLFKRPSLGLPGRPDVAPKESQLTTVAVPLWPANWSLERLLTVYEETPNRFRRIHLMDPRAEHGERLNIGWVTLIDPSDVPLEYARIFMGIDPAPGGDTDDLDFFNITIGALHGRHLDILQSLDVRADLGRQANLVGVLHDAFSRPDVGGGVVAIGGAKIAMDRYFRGGVQILRPDLRPKLVEVSIPGDKETRLEGLGPYAQAGWLRVVRSVWDARTSDPDDREEEWSLSEQWRDFPHCLHDDKLDGLDITVRTAQEFSIVGDATWRMEAVEA